jgi:hypothetical protein
VAHRKSTLFALLAALTLCACTMTTPPPLRGTHVLAESITLEQLETRADVPDANGKRVCSDLLLRQTSVERFVDRNGKEFNLGIIEISDNGHIADDVQKELVMARLRKAAVGPHEQPGPGSPGATIIVFVHGWHHRSKVCDNNLACFRRVLQALSEASEKNPAPVFGVYVGWRGDTFSNPRTKAFSFYNRKATAQRIGYEAGREILIDLDRLYRELNDRIRTPGRPHPVTMVTAGHSFGGALVYSAVEGALVRQLRKEKGSGSVLAMGKRAGYCGGDPQVRPIRPGIGDLVVLVNPAFEASRYREFVNDESTPGRYAGGQLPVLLTVASEADQAVKLAFPIGRSLYFSVFPWRFRRTSDIIGAGHYDPQTTHDFVVTDDADAVIHPDIPDREKPGKADPQTTADCHLNFAEGDLATCKCEYEVPRELADAAANANMQLASGSVRTAANEHVSLQPRNKQRDARSPYIVARVAPEIISAHSDIYTPRFVTFLTAYIGEFLEQSAQTPPGSMDGDPARCAPLAIAPDGK